ncbi:hypothetical protein [Halalkalibacter urbisdiaboli]|uniref:hypothetical protein n=1 Tax=Halalkalibacter urbisdiaboli TaxID=1960589 RepID=UPI000B434105|nr:hypothetical protein [Halalkalibacter urbisdiaboli]
MRIEGEKKAQEMELNKAVGRKYKSNEIQITCVHCKNKTFQLGKALLNTRGLTFFDLDWLNESAHTLLCVRCGYIHWFGNQVVEIEE